MKESMIKESVYKAILTEASSAGDWHHYGKKKSVCYGLFFQPSQEDCTFNDACNYVIFKNESGDFEYEEVYDEKDTNGQNLGQMSEDDVRRAFQSAAATDDGMLEAVGVNTPYPNVSELLRTGKTLVNFIPSREEFDPDDYDDGISREDATIYNKPVTVRVLDWPGALMIVH